MLDAPESQKLFPPDVLKRAKEYLDATGTGGTGAYTHSQGVELCREHVAKVSDSLLATRLEHIDDNTASAGSMSSMVFALYLHVILLTVARLAAHLAASDQQYPAST